MPQGPSSFRPCLAPAWRVKAVFCLTFQIQSRGDDLTQSELSQGYYSFGVGREWTGGFYSSAASHYAGPENRNDGERAGCMQAEHLLWADPPQSGKGPS